MYPHFIELHNVKGSMLMLNIDQIVCVVKSTVVTTSPMIMYEVTETYDEIRELMRKAGMQIDKGDPRIDQREPLIFEDLKNMIGEPVWNSNTGKWTLVRNYIKALEPDGVDVAFLLDAADNSAGMTAGDLIKFPLYRMKTGAA